MIYKTNSAHSGGRDRDLCVAFSLLIQIVLEDIYCLVYEGWRLEPYTDPKTEEQIYVGRAVILSIPDG